MVTETVPQLTTVSHSSLSSGSLHQRMVLGPPGSSWAEGRDEAQQQQSGTLTGRANAARDQARGAAALAQLRAGGRVAGGMLI